MSPSANNTQKSLWVTEILRSTVRQLNWVIYLGARVMYSSEQIVLPSTWCLRLSWTRLQIVLVVQTDSLSLISASHGFQYFMTAIIISIIIIYFIFSSIEEERRELWREKKAQEREESTTYSGWRQKMWNSCKSVFPNTRAWEQQEWNGQREKKWNRQEKNHKNWKEI